MAPSRIIATVTSRGGSPRQDAARQAEASRNGARSMRRSGAASGARQARSFGLRQKRRSARAIASPDRAMPDVPGAAGALWGVRGFGHPVGRAARRREAGPEPVRRLVVEMVGEPDVEGGQARLQTFGEACPRASGGAAGGRSRPACPAGGNARRGMACGPPPPARAGRAAQSAFRPKVRDGPAVSAAHRTQCACRRLEALCQPVDAGLEGKGRADARMGPRGPWRPSPPGCG